MQPHTQVTMTVATPGEHKSLQFSCASLPPTATNHVNQAELHFCQKLCLVFEYLTNEQHRSMPCTPRMSEKVSNGLYRSSRSMMRSTVTMMVGSMRTEMIVLWRISHSCLLSSSIGRSMSAKYLRTSYASATLNGKRLVSQWYSCIREGVQYHEIL